MHTAFAKGAATAAKKNMVLIQRIRSEWKIPMRSGYVNRIHIRLTHSHAVLLHWTWFLDLPISTPGTAHRTQLVMNPVIYVTLSIKMPYSVLDRYRWCRCEFFFVFGFTVIVYEFKESFRVFALCMCVCGGVGPGRRIHLMKMTQFDLHHSLRPKTTFIWCMLRTIGRNGF